MPNYEALIQGIVVGDHATVHAYVPDVPLGQTLTKAWFTVKASPSEVDPGLIQKVLDASNQPGTGQIEDTGGSGQAMIRVDLTPDDTLLLTPTLSEYFDVQVLTSIGYVFTPIKGRVESEAQVTRASA